MQHLIQRFLDKQLTRRGLARKLAALGLSAAAARALLQTLDAAETADAGLPSPGSKQMQGSGGELVMAQAKAAGSEYLFTNPGSFEVGLFDAQITSGVPLIMGLHEGIVIAMADGYHRAALKPAFVNVHVIAGTAQMGGQLYNASRDGAALVVTAGMLDNELWSDEGILAPRPGYDQKDVPRQFTKFCWEARDARSLTMMLRRAYKVATTAPGGPVYLAMTNGALETKGVDSQILPAERFLMSARPRPEAAAIEQTADWLTAAKRPLIVVGDEVWKSGAQADLVQVCREVPRTRRFGHRGLLQLSGPPSAASRPVQHAVAVHPGRCRPRVDGWGARLRDLAPAGRRGGALGRPHRAHGDEHWQHGPQLPDGSSDGGGREAVSGRSRRCAGIPNSARPAGRVRQGSRRRGPCCNGAAMERI